MNFEIIPARPEHAKNISQIHTEAVIKNASDFYTSEQIKTWTMGRFSSVSDKIDHFKNIIEHSEDRILFVAVSEGQVVGFSCLDHKQKYVRAVYVSPSAWHRGIGSALLRRVEKQACDMGIGELFLESSLNAQDFYVSNGWSVVQKANQCGTVHIPCIVMKKEV